MCLGLQCYSERSRILCKFSWVTVPLSQIGFTALKVLLGLQLKSDSTVIDYSESYSDSMDWLWSKGIMLCTDCSEVRPTKLCVIPFWLDISVLRDGL